MLKTLTYYDILKVTRDAPELVIQSAYRALMQLNHPDHYEGREEEAVKLAKTFREARDALLDPTTRAQYDQWLNKQEEDYSEQCYEDWLNDCIQFCLYWNQQIQQATPKRESVSISIRLMSGASLTPHKARKLFFA